MGSISIDDWCRTHGFSRSFFYVLRNRGDAPRLMRVGKCIRISEEANTKWVAEREAQTNKATKAPGAAAGAQ